MKVFRIEKIFILGFLISLFLFFGIFRISTVFAVTDCTFINSDISSTTIILEDDCTTDSTLFVPDGFTFDGNGKVITAIDPVGGNFIGAVLQNAGDVAHISNVHIEGSFTENTCDSFTDRLRGILFNGASGSITNNVINGINQGEMWCTDEGNAIELHNSPLDTNFDYVEVEVSRNSLNGWQSNGILVSGEVDASIHRNTIGDSFSQEHVLIHGVQLRFGPIGDISFNFIEGNQSLGAIFTLGAINIDVTHNRIQGNSEVGILAVGANGVYDKNIIQDQGVDPVGTTYDIGIWEIGSGNSILDNVFSGFDRETLSCATYFDC